MGQSEANEEKNKVLGGVLYLVATPIGNLGDISPRACKVLREASFVAAEDTRNSMKLLTCLGIKAELVSYFEHNKKQRGPQIVARLLHGESCALITDAGMPAISDPGEDLVKLCAEAGILVSIVPGCCAAVSALALSSLSTGRFAFEGFLPAEKSERKKRLAEIKNERRTLILYEAPHRLLQTLNDLKETFGDRRLSLCRELTKKNEEIIRGTVFSALTYYETHEVRGEYVLVLEGEEALGIPVHTATSPTSGMRPEEMIAYYQEKGLDRMSAIKAAAKDLGISKSELYNQFCKK